MKDTLKQIGTFVFALAVTATPLRAETPQTWPPADGARWQVWVKYIDEPGWMPWLTPRGHIARFASSETSCKLDIVDAIYVLPKGTRIKCARIDRNGIHGLD